MTGETGAAAVGGPDRVAERGIFDCDDAYRTASHTDYERLFSSAIIVLDTNVLINLYRSNERTRRDTFAVLNQVQERIWIPHQVLSEFWRNRDLPSIRGHHKSKAREACSALDKVSRSTRDALDRWLKDVHLANDNEVSQYVKNSTNAISKIMAEVKQFIEGQATKDALEGTSSTLTDPVLQKLEQILQGRIGDPFSPDEYDALVSEAARRADEKIPPGYKDFESDKTSEQASGDYLIWEQILAEAERCKREVLLVTGDVKEDWWVSGNGQGAARPRTELRVELRKRAGVELYMLTPSQLLAEADRVFGLKVDERSVSDLATSENPGTRIRLPRRLAKEIPACLRRSHRRASEAVRVANTNPALYGTLIESAVLEGLNEVALGMGGSTILLRSKAHPVLDDRLLFPFRYAQHAASVDHALGYLNHKKSLRVLFNDLVERPEELPLFDLAQPDATIPGLIAPVSSDLEIVLIPYASDIDNGIHSAHWATLRIDTRKGIEWEYVESLYVPPNGDLGGVK
ncbi:putative nucleic acid-binding protein [Streptomyces luteogriseus]|uniref:Putative nucleic acid-binding protein n=1 Tax=Streptomyces luteogriseus TaxID=68233 RepID=A0A7W7DNX4_9ACTN|nr:PIN domain-containing protein [Streptomyces luteogriseus]MBB4712722.1 putative nucleic acid-binding protein [Streptomyces luteogriseus]